MIKKIKAVFVDLQNDLYDRHGIYSLAALLNQHGVEVSYISYGYNKKFLSALINLKPDLLLYSSLSSTLDLYGKFDKMIKEVLPQAVSLIGGAGPTFEPQFIMNTSINAACIGEGERALIDFIRNDLVVGKNIISKDQPPEKKFHPLVDLDSLPLPNRDIIYCHDSIRRDMPSKQFISGRGCPFQCTYCFNHIYYKIFKDCGSLVRKKSVNYLLEEIKFVRKKYALKTVVFNDDIFILDKEWLYEFCERYPREIGLPYICNIRANLIQEDVVAALHDSNCISVNWSIESGNEIIRNQVLKRNMTEEQIITTGKLLNKYRIKHRIGNVIGLPGETFEQMLETVDLNIRVKPNLGLANIFVPYPGLELTNYAVREGHYTTKINNKLPPNYWTRSVLEITSDDNLRIQKLVNLFPLFVRFPGLFSSIRTRNILFSLPKIQLRVFYEIIYVLQFMDIYRIVSPPIYIVRTAFRYLKGLFENPSSNLSRLNSNFRPFVFKYLDKLFCKKRKF
ncbi:MAG: radical SAM protein [Deltaproteobacteria bacterium]|nr:radical SAM protein [Deltaproteobacteria bacterium]